MIKNAFYLTLKAIFVLKVIKFCLNILVRQKNGLIKKMRLILKFMTPQPGKQIIAIHILPNISKSKSNQTMEFGQLMEYNMRNIFLEKSFTRCGAETVPRLFSKKSKLSLSLDQQSKSFIKFVFIVCQVEGYIETKLQTTNFYLT